MDYKNKHAKIIDKLKNLSLKGSTKYSYLAAERENKITTSQGDSGYNLEVEAFNLKQIIDIAVHVLEKQMKIFQKGLFKKYQNDFVKFRKGMVEKNVKNADLWREMQDLIHTKKSG